MVGQAICEPPVEGEIVLGVNVRTSKRGVMGDPSEKGLRKQIILIISKKQ